MNTTLKWLLAILGILSTLIAFCFIYAVYADFYFSFSKGFSWAETGQVGDFFGGIVGTLVSALGFIFVYFSFKKQTEALDSQKEEIKKQDERFEKSQIESRFIELIKLHKENLYDIEYERGGRKLKDRKAIDFIFNQVIRCYKEISPFFENIDIEEIYNSNYLGKSISLNNKRTSFDLYRLAHLDIAYSIVFFGTSYNDLNALCRLFSRSYQESFISKIAEFIHLKPFRKEELVYWNKIKGRPLEVLEELRAIAKQKDALTMQDLDDEPSDLEKLLKLRPYDKYYGGHQYKLGQYFRHLFQVVKYINKHEVLDYKERYHYIKTLRAQLSTIEQYLIFFNSLSFMGRAWELEYVSTHSTEKDINNWLITKYNFIKNLPDLFLEGEINIKNYYPEVYFEFENEPLNRQALKEKFK